jgi:hypothetical protein
MNRRALLLRSVAFLAAPLLTFAAEQGTLDPNLEPLRPWLGKTWKSDAAEGSEKPKIDVARWERALNGKAVRILHSINDGEYGGETIVTWDAAKKAVVYHYFTTAGFTTTGMMTFDRGKILTNEKVGGNAGGVTEVRGTGELASDGAFRMKTEYLKDGKWQRGRDATYREDATATVIFK